MRIALLVLLCGCTKTLDLSAKIVAACDQPSVIGNVQTFTLRAEGDALAAPYQATSAASAGHISLPSIPPTKNGKLTLIGDTDTPGAVAGGLGSLDLSGDSASVHSVRLVVGNVGTFAGTTSVSNACSVMVAGRQGHSATLLANGTVLIAGGEQVQASVPTLLQSMELFDPATGSFTALSDMPDARAYHTATLLPNGQVLICGGLGNLGDRSVALSTCTLYDSVKKIFAATTVALSSARQNHTATVLANGHVVLLGGADTGGNFLASSELYDPAAPSSRLQQGPSLSFERMQHTATLLDDGATLLVTGGRTTDSVVTQAELWSESQVQSAGSGVGRFAAAAVRSPDGRVVIAGGFSSVFDGGNPPVSAAVEVYDAANGGLGCSATLTLSQARGQPFAQGLPAASGHDPSVLIGGGADGNGTPLDTAEIVTLGRQRSCMAVTVTAVTATMKQPRAGAVPVLLSGGDVLVIGGSQAIGADTVPADAGELYVSPR